MNRSVKQAFFGWLVLICAGLAVAGAGSFGTGLDGSRRGLAGVGRGLGAGPGNDGKTSQTAQADLLRYQFRGERQHGPVAVLADLEPLAVQIEETFLESAPDDRMAADGFRALTDYRQRGALVFEVGNEGDLYFSVLVSQDHGSPFRLLGLLLSQERIVNSDATTVPGVTLDESDQTFQFSNLRLVLFPQYAPILFQLCEGSESDIFTGPVFQGHVPRKNFESWQTELILIFHPLTLLISVQHPGYTLKRPMLLALLDERRVGVVDALGENRDGRFWIGKQQGAFDGQFQCFSQGDSQHKVLSSGHWIPIGYYPRNPGKRIYEGGIQVVSNRSGGLSTGMGTFSAHFSTGILAGQHDGGLPKNKEVPV